MNSGSGKACTANDGTQSEDEGTSPFSPRDTRMSVSRTMLSTVGAALLFSGLFLFFVLYVLAFFSRGFNGGDDAACYTAYDDFALREEDRREFKRMSESVDPMHDVRWDAQWSAFPPGWLCTGAGSVHGEFRELGTLTPPAVMTAASAITVGTSAVGAMLLAASPFLPGREAR